MKASLGIVLSLLQLTAALKPISQLRRQTEAVEKVKRDVDPTLLYPAQYLKIPIDHFHNDSQYAPHSSGSFQSRYWFDDTYYKPGGPVIVLQSGETDATSRLEFLQHGILYLLSMATGGIGVVFEHRYYGTSFPVPNLSVENLRFLTTDQALADMAYFAQNVVFAGHENENLTSNNTPYIAYGGSYAGALSAFVRKLYPDVYWGSISSSGVTEAIYDYWQYYSPVAQYGPQQCVAVTQQITHAFDKIFAEPELYNSTIEAVREVFGLQDVVDNTDVLNELSNGIAGLQNTNWDPADNSPMFYEYCGNISTNTVINPNTNQYKTMVQDILTTGGYGHSLHNLTNPFLNWIDWNNINFVQPCVQGGQTTDECFTTQNATYYQQDDLGQAEWRSWAWQYCKQYGYLQTGSGAPADQLPVLSRQINIPYEATVCVEAFDITEPSDVDAVNQYGGFDISYPRLAVVGGEWDPWRPATPLADNAPARKSSISEPSFIIKDAVHHWDEYGVFLNETTRTFPPEPIKLAHVEEVLFVLAWLEEWKQCH